MASAEWLACADPTPMLQFVLGEPAREAAEPPGQPAVQTDRYPHCRGTDRQRRLFLCACCRALDPPLASMLQFLRDQASDRKLRLFAVFCEREYVRFRPQYKETISSRYADVTERYADGAATYDEWDGIRQFVHGTLHHTDAHYHATHGIDTAVCCCYTEDGLRAVQTAAEYAILANACRDIFGNPFRPVAAHPSWLTSTVVALAEDIYADRAFDRMPILADSLQDAGCDNDDILNHCRQPGEHVRGCFVIDLLLGKA